MSVTSFDNIFATSIAAELSDSVKSAMRRAKASSSIPSNCSLATATRCSKFEVSSLTESNCAVTRCVASSDRLILRSIASFTATPISAIWASIAPASKTRFCSVNLAPMFSNSFSTMVLLCSVASCAASATRRNEPLNCCSAVADT